ncbi:hypothetical protein [Flavobacterium collinsii]|uniref:Protein SprT n=1 Tax=Flavobacterium collinsii TaxID=1114861 RepID=A0ABN7ERQ3_9FLAO|nr:hypothetical protein [Flavobacterium collinsii]CAA9201828.1 hypothetical protein FLACOL7796_03952 [Flavobacterium collinsii]
MDVLFEEIKQRINTFRQNGQVITAVYWLLKKYKLKKSNLKGFEFREKAKPDFILMTTEGDFGKPQIIRIPENTFEFPLELMLTLMVHEMVHVSQKTIKPYVLDKNEREWQAYYEMNFRVLFPQVPEISNFHKKFFAQKGLEYYNRMGEGSELQQKYAEQKKEVEYLIASLP